MFECGLNEGEEPTIDLYPEESGEALPCLLIEECTELAEILEPVFLKLGFKTQWATNREEALEMFAETGEGLVVMSDTATDLGSGFAQQLRKRASGFSYIIVTSHLRGRENKLNAYTDGVDDYFRKPLDLDEFYFRLRVAKRFLEKEAENARQRAQRDEAAQQAIEMNHALLVATQRFGELFDGLPMACFTFGPDGLIQDWNRSAEKQFGIAGYLAYQRRIQDVLQGENGIWDDSHIEKIFLQERSAAFDWSFKTSDGTVREFACTLFLLRSAAGEAQGVISSNLDITDRKQAVREKEMYAAELDAKQNELMIVNRRLKELTKTDTLTGLGNRRAFADHLAVELSESEGDFSLVMVDVDNFKSFNDTHGHQVGDEVLRIVANQLRSVCLEEETVCRYGGEEFVILLPNVGQRQSIKRAEAFRRAVEGVQWTYRTVTISLGVTTRNFSNGSLAETGTTIEETAASLIEEADAALYASKEAGRNRVTHAKATKNDKAA